MNTLDIEDIESIQEYLDEIKDGNEELEICGEKFKMNKNAYEMNKNALESHFVEFCINLVEEEEWVIYERKIKKGHAYATRGKTYSRNFCP